jgi:hypothetical protein
VEVTFVKNRKLLVPVMTVVLVSTAIIASPASAGSASPDAETVAALETVEQILGDQTAVGAVGHDPDSAAIVIEDGVAIDVPVDPSDGISVDPVSGTEAVFTPTDVSLGDFVADGALSVAAGDGYATVAQPLEDGDFRLAVVLEDADAPTQLSYDVALDPGVRPVQRLDGGFDFVDANGQMVGGIGAPWAVDAAGSFVPVGYSFSGDILTRTLYTNDATVFPVTTNWCLFGKNPNGSCRGSGPVKRCVKLGNQAAVVGGAGGAATALLTAGAFTPAIALGVGVGATGGCVAGLFGWG